MNPGTILVGLGVLLLVGMVGWSLYKKFFPGTTGTVATVADSVVMVVSTAVARVMVASLMVTAWLAGDNKMVAALGPVRECLDAWDDKPGTTTPTVAELTKRIAELEAKQR